MWRNLWHALLWLMAHYSPDAGDQCIGPMCDGPTIGDD
jgi:hypothetical protein